MAVPAKQPLPVDKPVKKVCLAQDALHDLEQIWDYTAETWSIDQADTYVDHLHVCLKSIEAKPFVAKTPFRLYPDLQSFRCRKHFIFFIQTEDHIGVVAILHSQMDLVTHLAKRLS